MSRPVVLEPSLVPVAPAARWSPLQCVAFRFAFVYYLLYSWPRQLTLPFGVFTEGLSFLDRPMNQPATLPWLRAAAQWCGEAMQWLEGTTKLWGRLATWLHDKGVVSAEILDQPTGSGDTMIEYVKLGLMFVMAATAAALWSAFDRRGGHPRLGRWLHLIVRFDLAMWMLTYGSIKLYSSQFGAPGLWRLTEEVGDMSPMGMVWTFLGASKPYEVFAGIGEVLGCLLLFHRRTALLGCVVTIGVMTNVCALNWMYDVPVKLFSTNLLLAAVCLLAPFASRLWALLVSNRASTPVDLAVVKRWWLAWPLSIAGWCLVLATLAQTHVSGMKSVTRFAELRGPRPSLYGVWDVKAMRRDGVEVPAADATRWRYLAIDDGPNVRLVTWGEGGSSWRAEVNDAAAALLLSPYTKQDEPAPPVAATLQFVRGVTTVKAEVPEPRTMADFGRQVDVERKTLKLTGTVDGHQVEVETVQRVFRLQRGFHWVQEMPFNR